MASFNYNFLQKYTKENGQKRLNKKDVSVYLFIIHDKDHVAKFKTEVKAIPDKWDDKKQRVKHQAAGAKETNDKLDTLATDVSKLYYQLRNEFPNMKWPELMGNIKGYINNKIAPVYDKDIQSFYKCFDEFIEKRSSDLSELTIRKYKSTKADLMAFNPSLTFDKIDSDFYDNYIRHLRSKKPTGRQKARPEDEQKGLLNDTIGKYIEVLKSFLRWAYEKKMHENTCFKESWFKTNQKSKKQKEQGKKDIVTLRWHELQQLYNYDFSNNQRLEKVRDLFCFMAFTLQRVSDAKQFNEKQITTVVHGNTKIKHWIFNSYKTGKEIDIPFVGEYIGKACEIAEKYNYNLPIISEQKFNTYIKEACEIAGLDREVVFRRYVGKREVLSVKPLYEYVSSHTGRRTGISILLNVFNVPIHKVRDISGHSDLKTLDGYLDKDVDSLVSSLAEKTQEVEALRNVSNG